MTKYPDIQYDAAYVPMREPSSETWLFDDHVYESLETAYRLQKAGIVKTIVAVGGLAKRYGIENIKAPFEAESDEAERYLVEELHYSGPIRKERLSQTSIANHIYAAEGIFMREGMESVLMVTALERALRLYRLGEHLLEGVLPIFHFTTAGRAPGLEPKEAWALRMQQEGLRDIPKGRDGWEILRESDFESPKLLSFWREYDAAQAALRKVAPPGAAPGIPDVIAHMNEKVLSPGMKNFAAAAAGNLVLADATTLPAFRSVRSLLPPRARPTILSELVSAHSAV